MLGRSKGDVAAALVAEQVVDAVIAQQQAEVVPVPVAGVARAARAVGVAVVVVRQAEGQPRIVVEGVGGLAADPDAARAARTGAAAFGGGAGPARVVQGIVEGGGAGVVVGFVAVAQQQAGFQFRVEAVAGVGDDARAFRQAVVAVAVVAVVVGLQVVIQAAFDTAVADALLLVVVAAGFGTHAQAGGAIAAVVDEVDRAAEGQRAILEGVGAAQDLGVVDAAGIEEFVRGTARASQWQAIEKELDAFAEVAGRGVGAGATDRDLRRVVAAGGLHEYAGLVGQGVLQGGGTAFGDFFAVDHAGATGHLGERAGGLLHFSLLGGLHGHRAEGRVSGQYRGRGQQGGQSGVADGQAQWVGVNRTHRRIP